MESHRPILFYPETFIKVVSCYRKISGLPGRIGDKKRDRFIPPSEPTS